MGKTSLDKKYENICLFLLYDIRWFVKHHERSLKINIALSKKVIYLLKTRNEELKTRLHRGDATKKELLSFYNCSRISSTVMNPTIKNILNMNLSYLKCQFRYKISNLFLFKTFITLKKLKISFCEKTFNFREKSEFFIEIIKSYEISDIFISKMNIVQKKFKSNFLYIKTVDTLSQEKILDILSRLHARLMLKFFNDVKNPINFILNFEIPYLPRISF